MKRMIAILLAGTFLLAGCQSIQPSVTNDAAAQQIEIVSVQTGAAAPEAAAAPTAPPPVFPERYNKELSFSGLEVQIDAEVVVPQLSVYPIYALVPLRFTQEQADQILVGLLDGVELYDESNSYNRKYIQGLIDEYEAAIQADAGNPETEKFIPKYKEYLERLYQEYETAPEDSSYTPASRILMPKNTQIASTLYGTRKEHEDGGVSYEWSNEARRRAAADGYGAITGVCFQPSGRKMQLGIENSSNSRVWFGTPDDAGASTAGSDFTEEEAKSRGAALLSAMGLDCEMLSVRHFVSPVNGSTSYQLRYRTSVPGTIGADADMTPLTCYSSAPEHLSYGAQESMLLILDNEGVYCFQWDNPFNTESLEQASATLLPWENIAEIIDTMFGVKQFWQFEGERDDPNIIGRRIEIDRIALHYMQVLRDAGSSEQVYVPVWDVCGQLVYRYASAEDCRWVLDANNERVITTGNDRDKYSLLTINAIDGSVIDAAQGY